MLTIRELIKTLYNAFNQKLKNHRGNWEQNDPTADDYIKNRPFYVDENKVIKIIPKQTITFSSGYEAESAGYVNIFLSPIIELVVGQEYDVVWDGMKYKCTAYEFDGLAVIGSNFIMNGSFDDEPFFIAINKEMFGGAYIATRDANSHTVEVTTKDVKKIDKKYLPYGIVTENDLAPVATSGSYNDLSDTPTIYTDVVRYDTTQNLTTDQKAQARTNINAIATTDLSKVAISGDYNELENKPCSETHTYSSWETLRYINSGTSTSAGNDFDRWKTDSDFIYKHNFARAWKIYKNNSIYLKTDYSYGELIGNERFWGNASLYNSSYENTGETWCIYVSSYSTTFKTSDIGCYIQGINLQSLNATLQTSRIESTTLIPLDEKFIPDSIQRVANMPIDHISYTAQELTENQKIQARTNIGAGTSSFSGNYNDLTDAPVIDNTLTISGAVADAKATGDAITQLTEQMVPSTDQPYMQLVTDVNGVAKWEEKLCYEEEHDIVFVEETTVTGPYGQFFTTSEWPLKEGCSYEVTYNGETYNCVPFTFSGQPCLGNAKMASTSLPDTGEPFIITGIAPKMYSYVMFKNNTTHTFSVRGPADVITKIPSKYLSASITAGTGLNANAMNGLPAENASGDRSHAEGRGTAIGYLSHAEGTGTAKGAYSHAEGFGTITSSNSQHAQGQYNVEDAENKYAHIVGNGTYDARSNAHTIDWDGNGWFAGGLKVGGTGQDDAAAVEVATKPYVDEAISNNIKQADWNQTDESAKDFILNKPVPMTDEEIDAICGGTLTLDITENTLVDITTGIIYRIYVEDGKLSMKQVNESTSTERLVFVDTSTDIVYKVYVEDGKLHMMEVE